MTVTVFKSKTKSKAKSAALNDTQALAVAYVEDRLVLDAELAKLSALKKRVEEQEEALLKLVDDGTPKASETKIVAGDYVVKFGPKGQKAVGFNKAMIRKALGADLFVELATFGVTELKKYMTGEDFSKAVAYDHVNKRRVTVEKAGAQD